MEETGIGPYIRARRLALGFTQKRLGEMAGISSARIAQIEGGAVTLPGAVHRRGLATALGVSHLDLLIAAGELTEDEVVAAGMVGVVEEDPDGPLAQIAEAARQINWSRPGRVPTISTLFRLYRTEDATGERQEGARIWDGPTETVITQRERTKP